MNPFLWAVLFSGALYGIAKVVERSQSILPPAVANADAATLLNFPPYTLQSGRPTTLVYMTPAGLSPDRIRNLLVGTLGGVREIALTRSGIPIDSSNGMIPAFVDLWTIQCDACGPPAGSPPETLSPSSILQAIMRRPGRPSLPINPAALNAPRELLTIMHVNAIDTMNGRGAPETIPIAGRQT